MKHQPSKLRGTRGKVSPLTLLKELCKKKQAVREEIWPWHDEAGVTNAAIRGRIEASYGITLSRDGQLSEFWSWLGVVMRQDRYNARAEQFEEWYRKTNPDASVERVRNAAIAFFMTERASEGDQAGFVEIADLDLKKRSMETKAKENERKIQVSERRVGILERKEKQADAAKEVTESTILTDAQKAERMRELFGVA